jgi:HEAT repeat protein
MAECLSNAQHGHSALRADPRPTHELISTALTEPDEHRAWEAVTVLHFRGNWEVLEAARQLCRSECPQERRLGADILGQLGVPERTYPDQCVEMLLEVLEHEQDEGVLHAVGVALGHLNDRRGVASLVRLKNHASWQVRYAVVFGLSCLVDDRAIQTLIELSSDEDEVIRDWAPFGLARQIDPDTQEIRDALVKRLTDTDPETRAEALAGLARRGDERVIEPLIKELSSDCVARLVVEAAETIGDPRLYPAVLQLKAWWDVDPDFLEAALSRCRPQTP